MSYSGETRVLRGTQASDLTPGMLAAEAIRAGGATGMRLQNYEIGELIGAGGMGAVYRARHIWLGRTVALKIVDAGADPDAIERFQIEVRASGALDHPNIVRASDGGRQGSACFLVTEYIDGEDAAQLVARRGPLTVSDACEVVRQAALGLQHAHEHGLVHRDVKPSNLLVDRAGVTRLIDFGVARLATSCAALTSSGQLLGTLDYLAPEQASNAHEIDIRADVYSLGCTLYFLLCGAPPFAGAQFHSPAAKIQAHRTAAPPPLPCIRETLPRGVAACLERMLAKSPQDRFATPGDVATALTPYCHGTDLARLVSEDLCYGLSERARPEKRGARAIVQRALNRIGNSHARRLRPIGMRSLSSGRLPLLAAVTIGSLLVATSLATVRARSSQNAAAPTVAADPAAAETLSHAGIDHRKASASSHESAPPHRPSLVVRHERNESPPRSVTRPTATSLTPTTWNHAAVAPPVTQVKTAIGTVTSAPGARFTAKKATPDALASPPMPTQPGWAPPPGDEGGMEYREMRVFGTPPPGIDPRQVPPGMPDMMTPPWLQDPTASTPAPMGAAESLHRQPSR